MTETATNVNSPALKALLLKHESEISKLKEELARKAHISSKVLGIGIIYPTWETFLFLTKKKGASGPTKSECFAYYGKWFVNFPTKILVTSGNQ